MNEPTTHFDPHETMILRIIVAVSSAFGLIGALITIISVIAFKHLRTAIARLIFSMAIADFVGILAKAVGRGGLAGSNVAWLCQTQAALMQWGDLSSIFWTVMISLNLIFIMYLKKALDDVKRYEKWYMVFCFIVPIPISIVPLFVGGMENPVTGNWISIYGDSDLWCWIGPQFQTERLLLFYGPLWTVFIFNLVTYLMVGALIWKMASQVRGGGAAATLQKRKYVFGKNTSLYLLAFLITWTPSTINRLYQMLYPNNSNFLLAVLMAICSPARGFTNFLVYFYLTWFVQVRENKTKHPHISSTGEPEYVQEDGMSRKSADSSLLVTGRGLSGIESEIGIDSNGYEKHTSRRWIIAQEHGIYLPHKPTLYMTAPDGLPNTKEHSFKTATQGGSDASPFRECTTSELYEASSYVGLDTQNSGPVAPIGAVQSRKSTVRSTHGPVRMAGVPLSDFGEALQPPPSSRNSAVSDMFTPSSFNPGDQNALASEQEPLQELQIQSRSQARPQ